MDSTNIENNDNSKRRQNYEAREKNQSQNNFEQESMKYYSNKVDQLSDQYRDVKQKTMDIIKGGSSSAYMHNNFFDTNTHNYLGPNQSTVFGQNFFASQTSPEYVNQKQSSSNINYYNVDFAKEEKAQQGLKSTSQEQKNYTVGSNIMDSSETFTQRGIGTPQNLPQTPLQNTMFPDNIQPKLQNIVSTANLKCELDLREIALKAKNAEYNPKRFAAVIMRIKEPKTTALIFASGKMVCTGARSEEDSKKAARYYAKIINKLGFPVKFTEFKIQNIVGSCDVRFPIRLEGLANGHSRFCSYEPEMFPGLIYRMYHPKIVLLIFVSGKIVLTGAKERNDIFEAFRNIYPTLLSFKKKETHTYSTELSVSNVNE